MQIGVRILGLVLVQGVVLSVFAGSLLGQRSKTNFCPGAGPYISVYAGPGVELGSHIDAGALSIAIEGGIGIDDRMYFHLFFGGMLSENVTAETENADGAPIEPFLQMGQGGVGAQFSPFVLPWTRMLLGARVGYLRTTWRQIDSDVRFQNTTWHFTPRAGFEFPLMQYVRLELGAAYRFAGQPADFPTELQRQDHGFGYATFRFGSF